MNKKIITIGCSFTKYGANTTWSSCLQKYCSSEKIADYQTLARMGTSNGYILDSLEGAISHPENKDAEVYVFAQLTGLERPWFQPGKAIGPARQRAPNLRALEKAYGKIKQKLSPFGWSPWADGPFEKEALRNVEPRALGTSKWRKWYIETYTPESYFNQLLERVLEIQELLASCPNVEYRIFSGWDIWTKRDDTQTQWGFDAPYENINNPLVAYEYASTRALWEKIDFDKFWFFENEKVHHGGLTQWAQHNLPPEKWYAGQINDLPDYHPSPEAHRVFFDKVIKPLVDNWTVEKEQK